MKVLPYVYKMTHRETHEFYIGVRYGNKYPPELDLGQRYWTSSKTVKPKFDEFDYEILAMFFDREYAIDFEQQLITEHWKDPLILNKAIQVSKTFRCVGHSAETRKKMSDKRKGKPSNTTGKTLSAETRRKISEKSSLHKHSEDAKEKIRQKAIGNTRGIGNKVELASHNQ